MNPKNHRVVSIRTGRQGQSQQQSDGYDFAVQCIENGEIMHCGLGPDLESKLLYVEQSQLAQRLMKSRHIHLFDIGLGAASNALAAFKSASEIQRRDTKSESISSGDPSDSGAGSLLVTSFETDLESLHLAFENQDQFRHFRGWESAVKALLENGQWASVDGQLQWRLKMGDFRTTLANGPMIGLLGNGPTEADVIYYDMYSPKSSPQLWTIDTLGLLRGHTSDTGALYTYTRSTRARVALLLGGFFIGRGIAAGLKAETTVAAASLEALAVPLDARWLLQFTRSQLDFSDAEKAAVLAHPQFSGVLSNLESVGEA